MKGTQRELTCIPARPLSCPAQRGLGALQGRGHAEARGTQPRLSQAASSESRAQSDAAPVLLSGGRQGFASDTAAAAAALCLNSPPLQAPKTSMAAPGHSVSAVWLIRDRSHLPEPLPRATHTDAAPREPAADMKQRSGPRSDHKSTAAAGQGRAWWAQPQPLAACTRSQAHSQEG